MSEFGWRTLIIDSPCAISCSDECMVVEKDQSTSVPLGQLKSVLVNTTAVTFSAKLLNELVRRNVSVLFCDEKHEPAVEANGLSVNYASSGKILDQTMWSKERRDIVWQTIVQLKIATQRKLLIAENLTIPDKIVEYEKDVFPGDPSNREGQAARIYFNALFGTSFCRSTTSNINSSLNYGYAILRSEISRVIALHGYHNALGIHHCNRQNPYNLSCDLMEAFRPFVDQFVFKNKDRELNWDYKKELMNVMKTTILYGGKKMSLTDAVERFSLDVFAVLDGKKREIGEVDFYE